mmetsp:Transcript_76510/g.135568  ORF Transcript_76510/g.135568 Transcript_76510/m.135568 type:complete len:207 (+) Transcript_76510:763-1383(+)
MPKPRNRYSAAFRVYASSCPVSRWSLPVGSAGDLVVMEPNSTLIIVPSGCRKAGFSNAQNSGRLSVATSSARAPPDMKKGIATRFAAEPAKLASRRPKVCFPGCSSRSSKKPLLVKMKCFRDDGSSDTTRRSFRSTGGVRASGVRSASGMGRYRPMTDMPRLKESNAGPFPTSAATWASSAPVSPPPTTTTLLPASALRASFRSRA